MKRNGNFRKGSSAINAKLTEGQVLSIRAAYKTGESVRSLAERHCMSISQIYRITHGFGWKSVGGLEE